MPFFECDYLSNEFFKEFDCLFGNQVHENESSEVLNTGWKTVEKVVGISFHQLTYVSYNLIHESCPSMDFITPVLISFIDVSHEKIIN